MKHEFIYKQEAENLVSFTIPETKIVYTVECGDLNSMCEAFTNYLRACGFVFDGYIGVVEEE